MTEIKDVPVESIQYLDEVYPRESWDQETVNRYRQAIGRLPPIQLTHEHILIDGYHRLMAHCIEQRKTIKAEIEQLERSQVLWEATKRNATHGLQLSQHDKKLLARRFFEEGHSIDEIALALSVTTRTIREKYLADIFRERRRKRNERIRKLYRKSNLDPLNKLTQEEIATRVSQELGMPVSRDQVAHVISTESERDPYYIERYVVESLGGTPTAPSHDGGIDGIRGDEAIQVTIAPAGRQKVDVFVAGMDRVGVNKGILVAPHLTSGARTEIERLAKAKDIHIEFREMAKVIEQEELDHFVENPPEGILHKYIKGVSVDELALEYGVAVNTITVFLEKTAQEMGPPDSLRYYNLWNFHNNDMRYGLDYPGRIPGQIVENVLYYYTEPFNLVVDPMAGGGTTLDVCKAKSRRYRCYDINPVRDDIKRHDITTGFPNECRGCNLIFLDPPYWSQKQGDYSDDETNLANLPLDEFYRAMDSIFFSAAETLAKGGHIAVIVGPTQRKGEIFDHTLEFVKSLEAHRFQYINRIIVPYSTQQARAYHVTAAKDGRFMLKLYRDLLIYRMAG